MSRRSRPQRPPRKVQERSAGAVVYHENGGTREFLLLRYGAGHWGFPKGHVEAGETDVETAQREITEETGIPTEHQRVLPGFEERTEYHFRRGSGTIVEKEVRFFVVESHSREVRISHEHTGFTWLPYDAALAQISFDGPRRVLQAARTFLDAKLKETT